MKAPAIIASLTIACSLGFAAGQGRAPVAPQAPEPPSLPPKSDAKQGGSGGEGGVAMQVGQDVDCVTIGQPLNVFTHIHHFPACVAQSWGDGGIIARWRTRVDLDGDGTEDTLKVWCRHERYNPQTDSHECIISEVDEGASLRGCPRDPYFPTILWRETASWTGVSVSVTRQHLFGMFELDRCRSQLAEWNPGYCCYWIDRWQLCDLVDVDGDGDLDLVIRLTGTRDLMPVLISEPFDEYLWIENTAAFNTTTTADVNRDGVIDGKDLAFVLSAWTQ